MENKSEEKKELSPEEVEKQTVDTAVVQFFQLSKLLGVFKRKKGLTRKGCVRAIQFALNNGITDKKIKLQSDQEYQLAQVIHEMLAPRTIMQADIIKRLEKENDNGEEKK